MILTRHAQSEFNAVFNLTREDPGIADPGLTEEGLRQARALAEDLLRHDVRRVLSSPYSRALQTAEIIAERLDLSVVIEPLVRERCFFVCDVGSPRSHLIARWPGFDFGALSERWWPEPEETEAELLERCVRFRAAMALCPDWRQVLVVSHWGFIRGLTGQSIANAATLRFDVTRRQESA